MTCISGGKGNAFPWLLAVELCERTSDLYGEILGKDNKSVKPLTRRPESQTFVEFVDLDKTLVQSQDIAVAEDLGNELRTGEHKVNIFVPCTGGNLACCRCNRIDSLQETFTFKLQHERCQRIIMINN